MDKYTYYPEIAIQQKQSVAKLWYNLSEISIFVKKIIMTKFFTSLFFILFLLSCIKEDGPDKNAFTLKEGDMLPEFSIKNETETISTANLKGKITAIIFFSTTCRDCQKAFPDIQALYEKYTDTPSVQIILIAREQTEEEVLRYFKDNKYNIPFFTDPDRRVYSLFADNTIPRLFLAGKDGKIVMTQTEYIGLNEIINTISLL